MFLQVIQQNYTPKKDKGKCLPQPTLVNLIISNHPKLILQVSADLVNLWSAIKMLLIHDLVEIDAGDTFWYNLQGNESKHRRRCMNQRVIGLVLVF